MILITGATGTIGTPLLEALAGTAPVRALTRDPDAAARLSAQGVDARVGSFDDIAGALAGVDAMFLLSPPGDDEMVAQQAKAVEAASAAGVRRVVKLSSIGADEPTGARIIRAHREIERHVEASGMAWTHLRPHWFMQNELGNAEAVAAQGTFYAPDVTRISMVDARDVAAVAARVLTERGHEGRAYVLTGPEAIGYADVAASYAGALGRTVEWTEVTLEQARASMLEHGMPEVLAGGFTEIMARYRQGGVTAAVSPDAQRLLGRRPRGFEDFVREHLQAFALPVA